MCGRSFLISSNSLLNLWIHGQKSTDSWRNNSLWRWTKPKKQIFKDTKVSVVVVVRCFLLTSAKAKKFQDGDRSIRLHTTISLQIIFFFSKIDTMFYQKDSHSFQQWVQKEAKRSIIEDYRSHLYFLKQFTRTMPWYRYAYERIWISWKERHLEITTLLLIQKSWRTAP